jgi:hypothetical protein
MEKSHTRRSSLYHELLRLIILIVIDDGGSRGGPHWKIHSKTEISDKKCRINFTYNYCERIEVEESKHKRQKLIFR